MNVRKALQLGSRALAGQAATRLEAEILLAFCLQCSRSRLMAYPEQQLSAEQSGRYQDLLERRAAGEPIAYLTGEREFWSLPLRVTPSVLIPRPETEALVEAVLMIIPADVAWRVADLGTGSGAIALAIASERPRCKVHGVDLSKAAIELARDNARRLGLDRVQFHTGRWCEPLTGPFDLIASNPPYVAEGDPHLQAGDCRFEPRQALTPGPDALAAIRQVAGEALRVLRAGGWLLLEHGPDQGQAVRALLQDQGYAQVGTACDLLGHERVTQGMRR
jgi:release factor glutamine methyltransferase